MDLLATLSYKPFNDFYIRVERIQNGWMDLNVSANGNNLSYSASYTSDPLNDLLAATVYIVKKDEKYLKNRWVDHHGKYLSIFHDLEPSHITWLFKYTNDQLMLVIWKDILANFDTLIENNFDSEDIDIEPFEKSHNLTKELAFALKGPINIFIKAVVNVFDKLNVLQRIEEETTYDNWGFNYSEDNLNILKEWLQSNSPL